VESIPSATDYFRCAWLFSLSSARIQMSYIDFYCISKADSRARGPRIRYFGKLIAVCRGVVFSGDSGAACLRSQQNNKQGGFMKKLVTTAVAVAVVVALFGAYHHVRAQANERPGSPLKGPGSVSPPIVLTSHALLKTYIDQAAPGVTVGSGFTAIDSPVTIKCAVAACTIGAENWVEVGDQFNSGDKWGVCTQVDGAFPGICTFQGYVPADGTFVTGSLNNAVVVSLGTHTVQAFVYTDSGARLAQYNNTYHVYKP
jgi:hypothetical protein